MLPFVENNGMSWLREGKRKLNKVNVWFPIGHAYHTPKKYPFTRNPILQLDDSCLWDALPCSVLDRYERLRGTCCLCLQGLRMWAIGSAEILIPAFIFGV
jgi:hypothetical protein